MEGLTLRVRGPKVAKHEDRKVRGAEMQRRLEGREEQETVRGMCVVVGEGKMKENKVFRQVQLHQQRFPKAYLL